jgi:hypothetical protein
LICYQFSCCRCENPLLGGEGNHKGLPLHRGEGNHKRATIRGQPQGIAPTSGRATIRGQPQEGNHKRATTRGQPQEGNHKRATTRDCPYIGEGNHKRATTRDCPYGVPLQKIKFYLNLYPSIYHYNLWIYCDFTAIYTDFWLGF